MEGEMMVVLSVDRRGAGRRCSIEGPERMREGRVHLLAGGSGGVDDEEEVDVDLSASWLVLEESAFLGGPPMMPPSR